MLASLHRMQGITVCLEVARLLLPQQYFVLYNSQASVCALTVQSRRAQVMPCLPQAVGLMILPCMGPHALCS